MDKTSSEILFEEFCNQEAIPFERIQRSNIEKRPDYKITINSLDIFVEVKELGDNDTEKQYRANLEKTGFASGTGLGVTIDGDRRVRKQIDEAMPQLKKAANSGSPTILILHDSMSEFKIGQLEIRLAMFGQDVIGSGFQHRFGKGQKVGKGHNRSLSAVGLLINEGGDLHLQLFHNHFAQTPLPHIPKQPYLSQFKLGPIGHGGLPSWEEFTAGNQTD